MRFIFAFFIFLATSAHADSINFILGDQSNSNGTSSNVYGIKYIYDLDKNLDIGLMINNSTNRSTNGTVSLYEITTRYKVPVFNKTSAYLGPVLGSLQPSEATSKNYVGLEVGVMTKPYEKVGFRADYTAMTGLNVNSMDNSLYRIWASYDLNKENSIAIRRDFLRGDLEFDAWIMSFQHRF